MKTAILLSIAVATLAVSGCAGTSRSSAGSSPSPAYALTTNFDPFERTTTVRGNIDPGVEIRLMPIYERNTFGDEKFRLLLVYRDSNASGSRIGQITTLRLLFNEQPAIVPIDSNQSGGIENLDRGYGQILFDVGPDEGVIALAGTTDILRGRMYGSISNQEFEVDEKTKALYRDFITEVKRVRAEARE